MPADNELPLYPTGQVQFGPGNLKTATLAEFTLANGATLRHALAQTPAGVSYGNMECTGRLEFEVSENGLERNVVEDVAKRKKRQGRFKDATNTFEIIMALSSVTWLTQRPDPVKVSCAFVGKLII